MHQFKLDSCQVEFMSITTDLPCFDNYYIHSAAGYSVQWLAYIDQMRARK